MTADPMTHPSPEAVERAMEYAGYCNAEPAYLRRGVVPVEHLTTLAAHVAALTTQLEAERATSLTKIGISEQADL